MAVTLTVAATLTVTVHNTHYTLHTKHYTLHITNYTLHTTHYTLHTTCSWMLCRQPCTSWGGQSPGIWKGNSCYTHISVGLGRSSRNFVQKGKGGMFIHCCTKVRGGFEATTYNHVMYYVHNKDLSKNILLFI